ncbi:MAG: UDP-N-acetylmuramate dehydrogenase [Eubacteriales bacterium]|jgi:UDP-N-acetylmuramate dehydrogenase
MMAELDRTYFENIVGNDCVMRSEPMANHTTFRIGGPADWFITPKTIDEASALIRSLRRDGIPFFVMGNGSDLLVSDAGFRGVVIQFGRGMSAVTVDGTMVHAESGALLSRIAAAAADASLTGFEFAGGIPGTLGGACIMNAGAYGGEMKQVVSSVTCLTADGDIHKIPAEELDFGYRHSRFSERGEIVLSADISLRPGIRSEIRARMDDLMQRRRSKQPLEMPSAGSTFKRPEGHFAGKLIMDAGLRGYRVGGAQVSEKHCGFVVNRGGATAADVLQLIRDVQARVYAQSGVRLEPEVRFLGDIPEKTE